jgi:hypothetical protein
MTFLSEVPQSKCLHSIQGGAIVIRLVAAILTTLVFAAGAATSALAVSPSEQQCIDLGGSFERVRGEVSCVIVEEGKNPKFTEETDTTGQGNIGNKQEQTTECGGTGSGKCPPGQFE